MTTMTMIRLTSENVIEYEIGESVKRYTFAVFVLAGFLRNNMNDLINNYVYPVLIFVRSVFVYETDRAKEAYILDSSYCFWKRVICLHHWSGRDILAPSPTD